MVPSIRVLIPKGSKGSVETPGPVTEAEHSAPRKDSAVTGSKNSPRMGTSGGNEYPFRLQGSQIDRERVRDGKRPATAFADDNDDADAHGLRQRSASSPVEKLIGYSRKPDDDGSRRSSLDGKLDNLKQQVKVQEEPICPPYAGPSDWDAKPRPYQVKVIQKDHALALLVPENTLEGYKRNIYGHHQHCSCNAPPLTDFNFMEGPKLPKRWLDKGEGLIKKLTRRSQSSEKEERADVEETEA